MNLTNRKKNLDIILKQYQSQDYLVYTTTGRFLRLRVSESQILKHPSSVSITLSLAKYCLIFHGAHHKVLLFDSYLFDVAHKEGAKQIFNLSQIGGADITNFEASVLNEAGKWWIIDMDKKNINAPEFTEIFDVFRILGRTIRNIDESVDLDSSELNVINKKIAEASEIARQNIKKRL